MAEIWPKPLAPVDVAGEPTAVPGDVPGAFADGDDAVTHSLAILATVYHYNHWIFDSIREHLGPDIVEVGAGVGNITQFLLNARSVACLEPCEPYRQYLSRRFAQHLNVAVHPLAIEQVPSPSLPEGSFDSAVCLNVLEHIADDAAALANMRRLLRPGASAIVLVPALPCIFGEMDKAMGHLRRYTRPALARAFNSAGLTVTHARYFNLLGVAGWWWNGRVRNRAKIPPAATRMFDRMVPVLAAIERIIPPLVGQSLLMVGRKRTEG